MLKALRELEAQAEWYTEATTSHLLLFQMRKLRFREGTTIVTCGGDNTKLTFLISAPLACLHTRLSL